MEKYGYMGIGAIQIDRCDACNLVGLDADELQNMLSALAKANYRSEAPREVSQRAQLAMADARVHGASLRSDRGWVFDGSRETTVVAKALLGLLLR